MMPLKKIPFLLASFLPFIPPVNAQAINVDPIIQYLPYGTNIALMVTPIGSNKPVLTHNHNQMMLPASTEKIITGLAAILYLGPNYQFETSLKHTGNIQNSKINGDVILHFSGDPTLTRKNLSALFATLKKQGIKEITGNLVIDTRTFEGHDRASGWSWNNLTACYNAPPSAIVIDGNCFAAKITPNAKVGSYATASVADRFHVKIKSEIITIPAKADNKYCELNTVSKDNNNYVLTGCLKQQSKKNTGISINFAIQDSTYYGTKVAQSLLRENGVKLKGKVTINTAIYKKTALISRHRSAPLSTLMRSMLVRSDNLIADTIFRTIGWKYYGTGTWLASSDAVRSILKQKANIDLGNSRIFDGSGLSRQNGITAEKMMEILQYIASNDERLQFIKMLPVAGKSGTLANRNSLKSTETNCVKAKTGYLDGIYNLAGFIETASGRNLAFVQFTNGYSMDAESGAKKDQQMKFEKALYSILCAL